MRRRSDPAIRQLAEEENARNDECSKMTKDLNEVLSKSTPPRKVVKVERHEDKNIFHLNAMESHFDHSLSKYIHSVYDTTNYNISVGRVVRMIQEPNESEAQLKSVLVINQHLSNQSPVPMKVYFIAMGGIFIFCFIAWNSLQALLFH